MRKFLTSAIAIAGLTFVATGCQQYQSRHEGVTDYAGNHLATNEALMADDYWKRNAHKTNIRHDGKRTADAVNKYKNSLEGDEAVTLVQGEGQTTN